MEDFLAWLTSLPAAALYGALAAAAAVENVVPPAPSDTVVAFGSFLAARGQASLLGAFLATWGGNVAGAMLVFLAGRRYGATRLDAKLGSDDGRGRKRVAVLYGRYGLMGLAVSRFLPGVRALVPPVAGALKLPVLPVFLAFAIASAIWYGAITVLAYRVGADWDRLSGAVTAGGKWTAIVAAALAAAGAIVWHLKRRRSGL